MMTLTISRTAPTTGSVCRLMFKRCRPVVSYGLTLGLRVTPARRRHQVTRSDYTDEDWVSVSASASYQFTEYDLTPKEKRALKEREKRPYGFTLPKEEEE